MLNVQNNAPSYITIYGGTFVTFDFDCRNMTNPADDGGNIVLAEGTEVTTTTVEAGKPDFDKFSFTGLIRALEFTAPGAYTFRVSEVQGDIGGVEYDTLVTCFDVFVGDADMDGALEIQNVSSYDNAAGTRDAEIVWDEETKTYQVLVTVQNTYAPAGDASATITIDKTVTSHSGAEQSWAGYRFELLDEDGQPVAQSNTTPASGQAEIVLTYGAEDAGKNFHYILREIPGETPGMTYDETEYPVTVSVVDNGDGTVSAYVYNTADYRIERVEIQLQTRVPENAEPEKAPIEATEPVTEPMTEPETTPVEVTEPGTVPIEFAEPATEPETVPVEVTEPVTEPEEPVKAPVEIPAPAVQVAERLVLPAEASNVYRVSFENVYDPADTQVRFTGEKTLTGRALNKNEFTFNLYRIGADFAVTDGMAPIQTARNQADGCIYFDSIDYDKVGRYHYVVTEDPAAALGGITYDDTRYNITVIVSDAGGKLEAQVSVADHLGTASDIAFENHYNPARTSVIFSGTKILRGGSLESGMFGFMLYRADENFNPRGALLDYARNNAAGAFAFDEIAYYEVGTTYYVITEDASLPVEHVEYDRTAYGVTVTIWDDNQGDLVADVTIHEIGGGETEEIRFVNTYTEQSTEPSQPSQPTEPGEPIEPTEPTEQPTNPDGTPDTGDHSQLTTYVMLLIISTAALIALLVIAEGDKAYFFKRR